MFVGMLLYVIFSIIGIIILLICGNFNYWNMSSHNKFQMFRYFLYTGLCILVFASSICVMTSDRFAVEDFYQNGREYLSSHYKAVKFFCPDFKADEKCIQLKKDFHADSMALEEMYTKKLEQIGVKRDE